ncbi:protein COFACTOR ASSEMBLY OF COMPLEX C SUBUNIT B CCB2, chloroplastic-like [Durio zibethinus]|uniref:Protein COFACTOR ASSEMBLY OF COMPLEX C SUBUNIT B CCB2, chloroplastic-like n=1 Tax=Durio zibethinus TaxID=66656 RepID=A0A6P5Y377_DURZI|nr:protein COFACTOR ASSEMBLY OF COMPLEX C SUBUNIT B CCB2, chloroplastic-like [Durio zibethinus]
MLRSVSVTTSQPRSEALGISLVEFSITLPYLGKPLKLMLTQGELSILGYWNLPDGLSKRFWKMRHQCFWIQTQLPMRQA